MKEKINIAELLKDLPSGMELDCILYDNIYFDTVGHNTIKCYIQNKGYRTSITFDFYGGLIDSIPTKCVIFPKGKTTWEGFQRSFKDGDIIAKDEFIVIFSHSKQSEVKVKEQIVYYHCYLKGSSYFKSIKDCGVGYISDFRFATEEEKEKLFKAIKTNGYKWNAETKTLEELIEPKFKVGDKIRHKDSGIQCTLGKYSEGISAYRTNIGFAITSKELGQWELAPNKFDINTLKPFDKVLVRDNNEQKWTVDMFSFYDKNLIYPFVCVGHYTNQCVPYEQNKHLLGTTDDCDDFYTIWK